MTMRSADKEILSLKAACDNVAIPGFGKFTTAERAARTGRNPQTGKKIRIPAKRAVKFTPAKGLKDAVAGSK